MKQISFLFFFLLFFTNLVWSQSTLDLTLSLASIKKTEKKERKNNEEIEIIKSDREGKVYTKVEEMPRPEDGMAGFITYQNTNLQIPPVVKEKKIQGRVHVEFVINKDGSVVDVVALNKIGYGCEEEAVRLIKEMPRWTPGKHNGEPVRVKMIYSIIFK